jgi:hypothetical protein
MLFTKVRISPDKFRSDQSVYTLSLPVLYFTCWAMHMKFDFSTSKGE